MRKRMETNSCLAGKKGELPPLEFVVRSKKVRKCYLWLYEQGVTLYSMNDEDGMPQKKEFFDSTCCVVA